MTSISRSIFSSASVLDIEVRDTDPHRAFDNDDLTESRQLPADENVDILSGGTVHLDDAALLQRQNVRQLHPAPVKLYLHFDPHVRNMGNFLEGRHEQRSGTIT